MRDRTADLLSPPSNFQDFETLIRARVRECINAILEEEVASALGAGEHERAEGRRGYRHGTRPSRKVMTGLGPVAVRTPRARLKTENGTKEFESQLIRRYERRSRRVDAALLTCYLTGSNTRKIKLALRPLLDGSGMSRSAVSRLVKKLQSLFQTWRGRDLSQENYPILVIDAIRLPVRLAKRVVKVPVQVVLGVKRSEEKELLELRVAPSESLKAWEGVVEGLARRGLAAPRLVMVDGNAGLLRSVREGWPGVQVQRCTKHKLENLLSKAPKHCHEELKRDFGLITHADDRKAAEKAYDNFLRKWHRLVPEVAASVREAGHDLLSFYDYPSDMWKSLRTTNVIERVNLEFRRRVKTQGSFPTEAAALTLLFGLIASGAIRLRKIDGYDKLAEVLGQDERRSA